MNIPTRNPNPPEDHMHRQFLEGDEGRLQRAIRKSESNQIKLDEEWVKTQHCPKCGKPCTFDFMYIVGQYTPFIQCENFSPFKSALREGKCTFREQF